MHLKRLLFFIPGIFISLVSLAQSPRYNLEKDLKTFRWQSSICIPDIDILSQQRMYMTVCQASDSCNTPVMWIEDNKVIFMLSDSSILSYKYIYDDRTRILNIWLNSHNQLAYEVIYGSSGYTFSLKRKYDVDKIKWSKRLK